MEKGDIFTRRSFLATTAIGAATLAGVIAGCSPQQGGGKTGSSEGVVDVENITWDKEADFVVAGSGTGLAGAIAAISKGCSVIVCEKAKTIGGSTIISGGGGWFPNTRYSKEFGDDRDKALAYVKLIAQGQSTDAIMEAFVDRSDEILEVIANNSTIQWKAGTTYGDYHPEYEGGLQFGRSCSPAREEGEPGAGSPLITRLQKAIEETGNEILTSAPVTSLVTRQGENGVAEVLGVIATPDNKDPIYIKANKGVLLACGGFEWDEDLKTNFLRGKAEYNVSVPGNNGDALRMCMALGSDLRNLNECWGQSCYKIPNQELAEMKSPAKIGLMYDRAKPGSIIVNKNGKRFINEACDYDTFQRAMLSWSSFGENGYLSMPSYLIADQTFVNRYGINQIDMTLGITNPGVVDDAALSSDTLAGLADQINVDPATLEQTVARFNEYAAQGEDPDFHRGESYFDRVFMSDMGQEFEWGDVKATLGTIETPPFYAMECTTGTLGTCGGPRVNELSQVVHVSGEPISRLYCSGNASSIGGPGASYAGAGGTIGPAITFAGIAGLHAADLAPWE